MSASFLNVGKRVGGFLYVHRDALDLVETGFAERGARCAALVPDLLWNVAKVASPHADDPGVMLIQGWFAPLFAHRGQPAECPWRLALVTLLQFAENLSHRRAADAVRGRIDWKYLLGLELTTLASTLRF